MRNRIPTKGNTRGSEAAIIAVIDHFLTVSHHVTPWLSDGCESRPSRPPTQGDS